MSDCLVQETILIPVVIYLCIMFYSLALIRIRFGRHIEAYDTPTISGNWVWQRKSKECWPDT